MKTIAVDLYGGDQSPAALFPGVFEALSKNRDFSVVLILRDEDAGAFEMQLDTFEEEQKVLIRERIIRSQGNFPVLTNRDNPVKAASFDAEYTMTRAFSQLGKEDTDCLLTVGNTAAALILSLARTGLQKDVTRPVLASFLPKYDGGRMCLLDCGANLEPSASDLLLFALLGAEGIRKISGQPGKDPQVALLSVGKEKGKGTPVVKEAYGLLEQSGLSFTGNAEPDDLYPRGLSEGISSVPDVVVCDGFSGNMILKNMEASGNFLEELYFRIRKEPGGPSQPEEKERMIWQKMKRFFAFNELGGAVLLGVKKPVVKAHGKANARTISSCLKQCFELS